MPSIENLKKQAKALVRLHGERSYHLSCVARETLPKFSEMSDGEILAAEFKLSDAQALIARQHGCADWNELKSKVETHQEVEERPAPRSGVLFAVPMLYVADVERSLACYRDVLGFEVLQVSGKPPFYAEVRRGGASLALRLVRPAPISAEARAREAMFLQASIRVGDIKALYTEFMSAGATFNAPMQREPWGPLGFVVEDPDGNLIGFGEPGPVALARDPEIRADG